jgi:hypothetical protein
MLIAVADWNTGGHNLTYFACFCRAFLELGCEVAALCPDPENVRKILAECGQEAALSIRHVRFAQLRMQPLPRRLPQRYRTAVEPFLFASHCRRLLKELEGDFGRRVDMIFLACLYEYQQPHLRRLVGALDRPWSGLNLHARAGPKPGCGASDENCPFTMPDLLHHGRLVALAVIDEEMAPVIEQALRKPVVLLPDITDERREANHPLEQRFLRFSGGSKLVLSIGHIKPNKGVINLAKVALDPAAREFAFAFVGEVLWSLFSPGERDFLEYALTAAPTAVFHTIRIPDGVAYNSVVHACDVLFAAYRDFPHSSNTLSKAALFEKPLIVSEGHLMARRVQEYRMGEIVPQEDPEATLRAIRRVTDDYPAWLAEKLPRWKEYREMHSYPALVKAFSRLLAILS